jgi:hypothetical protein
MHTTLQPKYDLVVNKPGNDSQTWVPPDHAQMKAKEGTY